MRQHAVLPFPEPQADEHVLCSSLLCSSTWQVPSETIHNTAGAHQLLTDAIVSLFACGACTCTACAWPRLHDGQLKHIVASPSLPCFVYQPLPAFFAPNSCLIGLSGVCHVGLVCGCILQALAEDTSNAANKTARVRCCS